LVEEGSPRKAHNVGLTDDDFELYEDEWKWILVRDQLRKVINRDRFQQAFPEFEWITANESLDDLLREFREESGDASLATAVEQVAIDLRVENVWSMAEHLREVISGIQGYRFSPNRMNLGREYRD